MSSLLDDFSLSGLLEWTVQSICLSIDVLRVPAT